MTGRLVQCAVAAITLFASPALAANVEDWRADIDTIVHDIETIHPRPFDRISRARFENEAAAIKSALPSLTDEQRMVRAMHLIAMLGDGHTTLAPDRADFALWYPVRAYQFTDGYFITVAYKTNADLAGAQILNIAGRPVNEVMNKARELLAADNPLTAMEVLFAFHSAPLMKGLGYAKPDGSLAIRVRLANGVTAERTLVPLPTSDTRYALGDSTLAWRFSSEVYGPPIGNLADWTTAYRNLPTLAYRTIDNTRPAHFTYRRAFVARGLPESNAYYIQVNGVGDTPSEKFEAFFRRTLAEIDTQHPRSLIIDVRYNSGGDGSKVPGMIHQFIKREDNPPWKECYLLTGRKTFSAAVMFVAAIIDHMHCSIVGEPAGEALDASGDPTDIRLSRTGIALSVSTVYHQLEDVGEHSAFIPVDVPAPFSFADWAAGRDPAVDAILRGDEMRSLARIALADGGAAARRVYAERLRKYPQYASWFRPREIDLIHTGWRLDDLGRKADLVEIYRLLSEIYPDSAKAWGRLGEAQIGNGDLTGGLASYRRALAIDPNNLANLDERQALYAAAVDRPPVIRWGAGVAQIERALHGKCTAMNTRRVDPPFLNDIHDKQMQIDCKGFDFAGAGRHAEFVFGDDRLKMVWVMVTPNELNALFQVLSALFGEPTHRNATYIAYEKAQTALRLDKAEVLFYAPELAPDMTPDFAASP